jgi:hypothetical protein
VAAYKASLNAHAALDLLISRAILEGKTGTLIMRVPMNDYAEHFEGPKFMDEAEGLAVEIEINTRWTEVSDDEMEADVELIEGIEDEDGFLADEFEEEVEKEDKKNGSKKSGSGTDSSGH